MPSHELLFPSVGSALNGRDCGSSLLIDRTILLDAPPAVTASLRRAGADPTAIDTVAITHLHGDHFFGLPFLLREIACNNPPRPRRLIGPPDLRQALDAAVTLAFPSKTAEALLAPAGMEIAHIRHADSLDLGDASLRAFDVPHNDMPTLALHLDLRPTRILYAPDHEPCDQINDLVIESDHAILDATTPHDRVPGHSSLTDLIALAKRNPRTTFYATHRSDYEPDQDLPPNVILPDTASAHTCE